MNKNLLTSPTSVVLCLCGIAAAPAAGAQDLATLIDGLRQSEAKLIDVKANFAMSWSNRDGKPEYGTVDWAFRNDFRQRLEGVFHQHSNVTDKKFDVTIVSVFDGTHLLRNRVNDNRGIVKPDRYDIENEGPSPKTFLGYCVTAQCSQYTSLSECLASAKTAKVVSGDTTINDHQCVEIEAYVSKAPGPDQAADRLLVWLDPACGYRPRQIEVYRNDYNALVRRLDEIDLKEVSPGIWLPIAGNDHWYAMDEVKGNHLKYGDDLKAILALPQDERRAAISFNTVEMNVSKSMSVSHYEINTNLPDSLFSYTFPKGCGVWDDFLQEGRWAGMDVTELALDDLGKRAGVLSDDKKTQFDSLANTQRGNPTVEDSGNPEGYAARNTPQAVASNSKVSPGLVGGVALLVVILLAVSVMRRKPPVSPHSTGGQPK